MFAKARATISKALGLDGPERDIRNKMRSEALRQADEARDEAKRSRLLRQIQISDAQYSRRVRGVGR